MKAVLVLNGEPPALSRLKNLADQYPVYAADGGAAVCRTAGVRPEWVVGDFDSQSPERLPSDWKILKYPEQDRTDFQKLLGSLPDNLSELFILGGLGKRLDHLITNLLIASEISDRMAIVFEAEGQRVYRVTRACPFRKNLAKGTTISLLPLENVQSVNTVGLKWDLHNAVMGAGLQLGQSNEVEGPVEITVQVGVLFVWVAQLEDAV